MASVRLADMAYTQRLPWALRAQPMIRAGLMRYRSGRLQESDVVLACYPKSGSTWLRFMLADLLGGQPHFDSIRGQLPPLGYHEVSSALRLPAGGRIITSHDPGTRMSSAVRSALILVRDGRDVAVSYYFWKQRIEGWSGSFPDFVDAFVSGRLDGYGPWHENVLSWVRPDGAGTNQLVVRYEDLLARGTSELRRVAEWLGLDVADSELERAYANQSRDRMRAVEAEAKSFQDHRDPSIPLVRSAQSGDWRAYFDAGTLSRFEAAAGLALERLGYTRESG